METEGSAYYDSIKLASLNSSQIPMGYTGLDKLRKIKKEMEMFYKDLIKILFMDSIDSNVAV